MSAHSGALKRIHDHLQTVAQGKEPNGPLFPAPEKPGRAGVNRVATHRWAVYYRVSRKRARVPRIDFATFDPHALRATVATNALAWASRFRQGPGLVG